MEWKEAIEEAKEELGYYPDKFIKDWNEVVETAKDILRRNNEEEYEDFCDEARENYNERLHSDKWKFLRLEKLKKTNFKCQDCGDVATQVHHNNYNHLDTPWEIYTLVSLCKDCHKKRHGIKE